MESKLEKIANKAKKIIEQELLNANIKYYGVKIKFSAFNRVGVQGDKRTYKPTIVLEFPLEQRNLIYKNCSEQLSTRLTNEINEINSVVYTLEAKDETRT